jgi:hypothetical protein
MLDFKLFRKFLLKFHMTTLVCVYVCMYSLPFVLGIHIHMDIYFKKLKIQMWFKM